MFIVFGIIRLFTKFIAFFIIYDDDSDSFLFYIFQDSFM